MFTGIIECLGSVVSKKEEGTNVIFGIQSDISIELKIDQSLSHNGVCLTVVKTEGNTHFVTAVQETIAKSNMTGLHKGSFVNLERAMLNNGRFDGHVVQGHVDGTAVCKIIDEKDGSWVLSFQLSNDHKGLLVEKGSICINGVSLTCFDIAKDTFSVVIVPYTYDHTIFNSLNEGDLVNIEFDVIGKYVKSIMSS